MWGLIEREIQDNIVHVAGLCLASAMIVALFVSGSFWDPREVAVVPSGVLLIVLLIGFCSFGAAQMSGDRANRISSLLATLAVTRSRIFLARVLVGMMTVLASLGPVIVGALVLLWALAVPLELFRRPVTEISITLVLTGWACYSAGLLVGWTTSKGRMLGGMVLLLGLVESLVAVKGFGPESMAILLLFIAAVLLRTWRTFISASL